jgi:hypothetical protein
MRNWRISEWVGAALCVLLVMVCATGCDSESGSGGAGGISGPGADTCEVWKRKLSGLQEKRGAAESEVQKLRGKFGDLEAAGRKLNRFAPRLKTTTVHINPNDGPGPREISGHIRNGTNEMVSVMHLRARFVPADGEGEPMEREVAYELQEPLAGGEVQHSPLGQQLVDAFPDMTTEAWVNGELVLEVGALEGPDGEVLWDRRGPTRGELEAKIEKLESEIDKFDEQIAKIEPKVGACAG